MKFFALKLGSFLPANEIAVDLGTANTLVYVKGEGIVLNEPSVVAIEKANGRIKGIGLEAKRMLGRTPDGILAVRPLKDGVIADFDVTEKMLRYFLKTIIDKHGLPGPSQSDRLRPVGDHRGGAPRGAGHAIRVAIEEALEAKEKGEKRVILVNLSGNGNFDMTAYQSYLSGMLEDYAYPEEAIKASMAKLPKVPMAV